MNKQGAQEGETAHTQSTSSVKAKPSTSLCFVSFIVVSVQSGWKLVIRKVGELGCWSVRLLVTVVSE